MSTQLFGSASRNIAFGGILVYVKVKFDPKGFVWKKAEKKLKFSDAFMLFDMEMQSYLTPLKYGQGQLVTLS